MKKAKKYFGVLTKTGWRLFDSVDEAAKGCGAGCEIHALTSRPLGRAVFGFTIEKNKPRKPRAKKEAKESVPVAKRGRKPKKADADLLG